MYMEDRSTTWTENEHHSTGRYCGSTWRARKYYVFGMCTVFVISMINSHPLADVYGGLKFNLIQRSASLCWDHLDNLETFQYVCKCNIFLTCNMAYSHPQADVHGESKLKHLVSILLFNSIIYPHPSTEN